MADPARGGRRSLPARLFTRGSWPESHRIITILHKETVGGAILLAAAAIALIWANSPWAASYHALTNFRVGSDDFGLHLNLSLGGWAADGLLAIFFFVVGLGTQTRVRRRGPSRSRQGGAADRRGGGRYGRSRAIFVAFTVGGPDGAVSGWAIPTATDIAFAVAVLAVISTHLPAALRTFLLTLAVVDDLLAITVIAVFYTAKINLGALLLALVPLAVFAILVQRRISSWWLLVPLGVDHLGLRPRVRGARHRRRGPAGIYRAGAGTSRPGAPGLAERFEHVMRPVSAGFAVPVFAFFAAGVSFGGYDGFVTALRDPIALGIIAGLVVGKTIGMFGTTRLIAAVDPREPRRIAALDRRPRASPCWPASDSRYRC